MMQQANGYVICYFLSNGGVVYTGGGILMCTNPEGAQGMIQ